MSRQHDQADGGPPALFAARHAPLTIEPDIAQVLAAAYGEPHRAYHNAAHIAEVLRWFDFVADQAGWHDIASVYLALVFHDAVYDPGRTDNEARSAELARVLVHAGDATIDLILLTARHGSIDPASVSADAGHFLDCDTAILGAPLAELDAYDAAIAAEYRHVPTDAFRAGRRRFLEKLHRRPHLFLTELFRTHLERAARANLERLLARYAP